MIEDDFTWVLRKALKGHSLAPTEAAQRAGLQEQEVLAFSKGKFSESVARGLADALGLRSAALMAHPGYEPRPLALHGIKRLEMALGDDGTVNAWSVSHGDVVLLFDTGNDPTSAIKALNGVLPDKVFITHAHHDHIAGNPTFAAKGIEIFGNDIAGAKPIHANEIIHCGSLTLTAVDLSGHARPALGYLIEGLKVPVLVTGDAIFAGSIGGCENPEIYQVALHRLHQVLAPLSDATVLLPGHGPATTLGEERVSNPFPVF